LALHLDQQQYTSIREQTTKPKNTGDDSSDRAAGARQVQQLSEIVRSGSQRLPPTFSIF